MPNQYDTKICRECKKDLPADAYYFKDKKRTRREPVCKECKKKAEREGYNPHAASERHLQRNYGIGVEDRRLMWENQGGVCKICNQPGDGRWSQLCVDHDHTTGMVRDLLCRRCNTVLGEVYDNPNLLNKMSDYLNQWQEQSKQREVAR